MARGYRPRHQKKIDRFQAEYEICFEGEYGLLRPMVKEVVEWFFDCGNPYFGFIRIRYLDYKEERLLMFSPHPPVLPVV